MTYQELKGWLENRLKDETETRIEDGVDTMVDCQFHLKMCVWTIENVKPSELKRNANALQAKKLMMWMKNKLE